MRKPDNNDPHVHATKDEKSTETKSITTKDYNTVSQDRYTNPALPDMDELTGSTIPKLEKIGVTNFNSFEKNEDKIIAKRILEKGTVIKITERYQKRRNCDGSIYTESGVRQIGGDSYQLGKHG